MVITNHINALLDRLPITETVSVMQADAYSRNISFHLYSNNMPATFPETTKAIVRYLKQDGTGGSYDTLPDGSAACAITDNVLTVALAPQVCTVPGIVRLTAALIDGTAELHVFTVLVQVHKNPGLQATSEGYYNVRGSLPDAGWEPNKYLGTDANGNVVELDAPTGGTGGSVVIDATLTQEGQAADAKAVGDALGGVVWSVNGESPDKSGNVEIDTGSGDVRTVNGSAPDENGNVDISALPLPDAAAVGQYFRVKAVDESGRVTAVEAVSLGTGKLAACLYNGVDLPPLPAWDQEAYPYAYLYSDSNPAAPPFYLRAQEQPIKVHPTGDVPVYTESGTVLLFANEDGAWVHKETFTSPENIQACGSVLWANFDVRYKTSGTIYLAASTPLPVYTDTLPEDAVTLTGADGKTYRIAVDASGTLVFGEAGGELSPVGELPVWEGGSY